MRNSTITIRENKEPKQVRITSEQKPLIIESLQTKWQSLIDTAARIVNVPSGLIMRLNEDNIEVFLSSQTEGNPYEKGEQAKLDYGLYCETVIGTQKKLLIRNARGNAIWGPNNPDVEMNMISYIGFPINWPDGEVFGTVCLLDNKENSYNQDFESLLYQIKNHIEDDLALVILNKELQQKNFELEQLNNTKTRFLSLISHDIRGNIGSIKTFLQLLASDFEDYSESELKNSISSLSQVAAASSLTLENILKWSKDDLIGMKVELAPVDILQVIEEVLSFHNHYLNLKGLRIEKVYSSLRALVQTDKNMLTAILRNILSNAIKFTPRDGSISIMVQPERNQFKISVIDSGVGMSEAVVQNLFQYNNEHTPGTMNENIAGIGLMLSKDFAEKLGAEIKVESALGSGSKFSILL